MNNDVMPWESAASAPPQTGDVMPWETADTSQDNTQRKSQDYGIARTIADQAVQGATFGFGDEASDRLGAIGAKLYDKTLGDNVTQGQSIGDLINEARHNTAQRLPDEFATRPALSVGANLAGGLLTGGAGGETAAGSAIGNSLRTGGLGARTAKSALAGAASGAAYGAGAANDGNRLQGAEEGLVTGAVAGGAIPGVGATLSDVGGTIGNAAKGLIARSPESIQNAAGALKSNAGALYDQMRQVGATLNPNASGNLASKIDAAIAGNQFIPALNPKTLAIVEHIKDAIGKGDLGLGDLDQYRRLLGRVGATEDGVSAGAIRDAIDDTVNGLAGHDLSNGTTQAVDLLNEGRKQYQMASKFEDISDILTKADGDPNKIKAGLTRFMNNAKNLRGWNEEEKSALKDAASGSGTEKLLKMGGKFGIDLGNSLSLGNTVAPIIGGAVGGLGAPVAGTAARIGQKLTARGKAETLLKTLEGKSPSVAGQPVSGLLSAPAAGSAIQARPTSIYINEQTNPYQGGDANIPKVNLPKVQMQPAAEAAPQGPDVQSFAQAESSGNPLAKNPKSSASGLYGFTNKTWADMVSRYGQDTGITLKDKNDAQAQATMASLLAKDNIKSLQKTLGRMPEKAELYMAHVLGATGAAKLINAPANKEAIMLYPRKVLDANREIFFEGKKPRTVQQVYQLLANKVS